MTEKIFVNKLKKCFIEEGFLVCDEIGVGHGVADLVLIRRNRINTRRVALRRSYHQVSPLLKEEYFRALSSISDSPRRTSLDFLIKKTHLSKPFLRYSILKTLEEKGYIRSAGKDYYFKINGWIPLASELIAVEAKLRDWKRGLVQANRYKVFASKVYLAIPSSIHHTVDRRMLRKHGIGLISFDPKGRKKRIILPAHACTPSSFSRNNFAVEHFWSKGMLREVGASSV